MNENASRNLILGLATGMPEAQLRPFFLSLERAGYRGDVCLFVKDLDRAALDFLRARRVNLVPLPPAYLRPRWARFAAAAAWFMKPAQRRRWRTQAALSFLHPAAARFVCYQSFLEIAQPAYDRVLLADTRDILFQRDPFDFALPDGLGVFMEDGHKTLGNCPMNSKWLRLGFGGAAVRELGDKKISCAGTVIGTTAAMEDYLERMTRALFATKSRQTIDQAAHNWVIYRQPPPALHFFDNETGPVLTMHHLDAGQIRLDENGRVLNAAGHVVNTLHQYDRHPELARKLLAQLA
ncbi:MAG: hypothetical protein NTZ16_02110 [Verrucomicrobia bacterium]|nr:hypothetical protein [Verrucomicrobiota bacterium]